jgi:hypothetical protein
MNAELSRVARYPFPVEILRPRDAMEIVKS